MIEVEEHFLKSSSFSQWLSLLVHKYEAIDKVSKKQMWKIKHTEVVDTLPEEQFSNIKILTRG